MSLDFTKHLFRCSSLGKLMTGVKPSLTEKQVIEMDRLLGLQSIGKITEKQNITLGELLAKKHAPETLSTTTINYLKELHKEELLKRNSRLTNKYCDKGIAVEEQSITLYSEVTNTLFLKNKERLNNEFFTGEPDNLQGKIRDLKNSWNYTTFPFYDLEVPNSDNEWQMLGYMDLSGFNESDVIYTLIDTPFKQIEDELRRLDWKYSIFDFSGDVKEDKKALVVETVSNMIYTEKGLIEFCQQSTTSIKREWFTEFRPIPINLRYKVFPIVKDINKIDLMKKQVPKWRAFLNELSLNIANQIEVEL